jgi:hypothetical protein
VASSNNNNVERFRSGDHAGAFIVMRRISEAVSLSRDVSRETSHPTFGSPGAGWF